MIRDVGMVSVNALNKLFWTWRKRVKMKNPSKILNGPSKEEACNGFLNICAASVDRKILLNPIKIRIKYFWFIFVEIFASFLKSKNIPHIREQIMPMFVIPRIDK